MNQLSTCSEVCTFINVLCLARLYCINYKNLITFFYEFVLARISPYQDVNKYHIRAWVTKCNAHTHIALLQFGNSPHANSLQGWAFPRVSCFSFLRPPPAAWINIINTGTNSDENSARLPAVSIVCLIHFISPQLFLHSRRGEMGQFSLSAPNVIWLPSRAASVFAQTVFQQTSFIIYFKVYLCNFV